MEHKLIYLARRNPAIAPADFGAAWASHAAFANRWADTFTTHFRSARQCIRIHDADVSPAFENDHDGVALLEMNDRAGLDAVRHHPIVQDELKRDEERVFAGHVDPWTMPSEAITLMKRGGGRGFLLSFLKRRAGLDEETFQVRLALGCERFAACPAPDHMTRIVRNRVIERKPAPYDFSAVIELWFTAPEAAIVAARDAQVIAALSQAEIADPADGVRLVARLNVPPASAAGA